MMQAAFVGSDIPVIETELGREIYVRIVFDKGSGNIGELVCARNVYSAS